MSTTAPQLLSRKTNGASSGTQPSAKGKDTQNQKKSSSRGGRDRSGNDQGQPRSSRRAPSSGEKVVVRRLPPGMTEAEFTTILGPDWAVGKGLVDWFCYADGKVSSDAAKPSIPARAYLHLIKKESTMDLNEVVRTATWEDAKSTFTSASLIAPPALEFAIYKKVPNTKKRTDARQGTIDQDPEFMAFLEGLANPAPPPDSEDVDDAGKTDTKVTTTPLVEYLKERKANKGKDSGKGSKHSRQESGTGKGKGVSKDEEGTSRKKGREAKGDKATKPLKDNVKILTKKSAAEKGAESIDKPETASSSATANSGDAPKSRRAGIAAAARLLQRDLGLSPGSAHRRARQDAAKADTDSKSATTAVSKETYSPEAESSPKAPTDATSKSAASTAAASMPTTKESKNSTGGRRNRGGRNADKGKATDAAAGPAPAATNPPIILKKKPQSEMVSAEQPKETAATEASPAASASKASAKAPAAKSAGNKKAATISPGVTRGFVKHANSSQGVTEPLLREALQAFGPVSSLELDKRKGFAYVEFADHDSLVKAASGSPINVAQGSVQVMERKDKKAAASAPAGAPPSGSGSGSAPAEKPSGGRGRRGRGAGGGGGGKNHAAATASTGPREGGQQPAASATANGG